MKPVLLLHRNQRYHGFSNLQISSLLLMAERGSPALLPMPGAPPNAKCSSIFRQKRSRGKPGSTLLGERRISL
jgi:hypothetical protein